jgi:Transposase domain (DUF772)
MPYRSLTFPPIPIETARAAEAIFGTGNVYMVIGDQLDRLLADVSFGLLDATGDRPASSLLIPALVTIFQFAEHLADRRAADALCSRLDWKYALHLSPDYPGVHPLVLCEFRKSLFKNLAARQVFQLILNRLSESGLVRFGYVEWPNAHQVLLAVCRLSRLERLIEAMRLALEALADRQSEWLRGVALPHWYKRYDQVLSTGLLPCLKEEQEAMVIGIGTDAVYLLEKAAQVNGNLAMLTEVQALWREWHQQFNQSDHEIKWRLPYCLVCNGLNSVSERSAIQA